MAASRVRRFIRRTWSVALAALACVVVFTSAALAGTALHLNLPIARRATLALTNDLLDEVFAGRIEIERLERLSLGRASGIDARAVDPAGRTVIHVRHASARVDSLRLVASLLGKGPVRVRVRDATAEECFVSLDRAGGQLAVAQAFEPASPDDGAPGGKRVEVHVEPALVDRCRAEGRFDETWIQGEVLAARGAVHVDAAGVRVAIEDGRVRVSSPVPARAEAEVRGSLTLPPGGVPDLRLSAKGRVGAVSVDADGRLHGDHLELVASVPRTSPDRIATLWPGTPLRAPLSARAELSGTLAALRFTVRSRLGPSRIEARGSLYPPVRLTEASVLVQDLSPRDVSDDLPDGRVSFDATASARLGPRRRVYGTTHLRAPRSRWGDVDLPALTVSASLLGDAAEAEFAATEPGAPTRGWLRLESWGRLDRPRALHFRTQTRIAHLERVERIGGALRGRATLRTSGVLSLAPVSVDARAAISAAGVSRDGFRARHVRAEAVVSGPLDTLVIDVTSRARGVSLTEAVALDRVSARAAGPLDALEVKLEGVGTRERFSVTGRVSARDGARIETVNGTLTRNGVHATLHGKDITAAAGGLEVGRLAIDGVGRIEAAGLWSATEKRFVARGRRLDLSALLRAGDLERVELSRGRADFDLEVHDTSRASTASLALDAAGDRLGSANAPRLRVRGAVRDGRARGTATLDLGRDSTIRVSLEDARFDELGLDAILRTATGGMRAEASVALRDARSILESHLGVTPVSGRLVALFRLEREAELAPANLDAYVHTRSVRFEAPRPASTPAPARSNDAEPASLLTSLLEIDWTWRGRIHGTQALRVAGRASRDGRSLLSATLEAQVPAGRIFHEGELSLDELLRAPIRAEVNVADLATEDLPPSLRPRDASFGMSFAADASGTLADPTLHAGVLVRDLSVRGVVSKEPLLVRGSLDYERDDGRLLLLGFQAERPVLELKSTFQARARELVQGDLTPLRWTAKADATLHQFSLDTIAWGTQKTFGKVDGRLELELTDRPNFKGTVDITRFRVGAAPLHDIRAKVDAREGRFEADVTARSRRGSAGVHVESALRWPSKANLAFEPERWSRLEATFDQFDLGIVQPFVTNYLTRLDGKLDGTLRATVKDGELETSGRASVREGLVDVPAIGQEFHAVRFDAVLDRNGRLVVRDAAARGLAGRVSAEGHVQLDGLAVEGGRLEVTVPKGEELPLTMQGVPLGRVYGRVVVEKVPTEDDTILLRASVPRLVAELPPNVGRDVQGLDDAEHVEIGVYTEDGEFRPLPLGPPEERRGAPRPVRLEVALGREVWLRKANTFRARLSGRPTLAVDGEFQLGGRVQVEEGWVDVLGKRFTLVEGTVVFQKEDPTNPVVVATAQWESPEGYTIFVDYTGPVKTGKLELRSSPPLSESEVLSVLLFGTPSGQITGGSADTAGSSGASSAASGAAGVGGGVFTAGLNRALSGLSEVEVTTRVDTSYTTGPRPEVAVQVSRRVGIEIAYNPGASLVARAPDHALVTLMLRLRQHWMLETTVGDAGTTIVDLIWRLRY